MSKVTLDTEKGVSKGDVFVYGNQLTPFVDRQDNA